MKLPTRSLPPNFGADIQAAGLGGLPFSWGSDADLNLDDPRLSPDQKNAILGVALKDTPLGSAAGAAGAPLSVTNADVLRFLGQRDAAGLPGVGAIGGGGNTGAPTGAPDATPDVGINSTENGQAVDNSSPGFSFDMGSLGLNGPNVGATLGALGGSLFGGPIGGVLGGLGGRALGTALGKAFGAGTGNAPPNSTNFGRVPQQFVAPDDVAPPDSPVGPVGPGQSTTGIPGEIDNSPQGPNTAGGAPGPGPSADAGPTGPGSSSSGTPGGADNSGADSGPGPGDGGDGGPGGGDGDGSFHRGGSVRKPMSRAQRVRAFEAKHGSMEI